MKFNLELKLYKWLSGFRELFIEVGGWSLVDEVSFEIL